MTSLWRSQNAAADKGTRKNMKPIKGLNDYRLFLAARIQASEPKLKIVCDLLKDLDHEDWSGFDEVFNTWILSNNRSAREEYEPEGFLEVMSDGIAESIRKANRLANFPLGIKVFNIAESELERISKPIAVEFIRLQLDSWKFCEETKKSYKRYFSLYSLS